ncbi:MAG: hypothetical protein GY827_05645 [Cytophagales bacterium]|nr:hypothetical protein [Cytophagales bacterium]
MKIIAFIFVLVSFSTAFAQPPSLSQLRRLYFEASYNEEKLDSVITLVNEQDTSKMLNLAYMGSVEVLKAKYEFNPWTRYWQMSQGVNWLEKACKEDNDNFEVRFLRFAVEYHIPSIVGMKKHLEEDKAFMLTHLSQIKQMKMTNELAQYIYEFLELTKLFTKEELLKIKQSF